VVLELVERGQPHTVVLQRPDVDARSNSPFERLFGGGVVAESIRFRTEVMNRSPKSGAVS
jgi:hypothetical protein